MTQATATKIVNPPTSFRRRGQPIRGHERRVLEPLSVVARDQGLLDVATRLDRIRRWLDADLDDLEAALRDTRANQADLGRRAARHLLEQPGKRIRPLLVFLTARLGQPASAQVVRDLAVAAELAHAATLLHDDVLDQGTERRGAPTAAVVFGNSASVLGGDHLLIETLLRVERSGQPALLRGILAVISEMVAAEALQLEVRGRFVPDEAIYQRVAAGKTAVLFCWALRAGATVAGLPAQHVDQLDDAGQHLGLAFQLVDDVLDLIGDPALTGKNALLDLREGKLTWPLLVAAQRDATLVPQLQDVAAHPERLDDDAFSQAVRRQILATGCVDATRDRAMTAADDAKAALTCLPTSAARDALETVIDAAVARCR